MERSRSLFCNRAACEAAEARSRALSIQYPGRRISVERGETADVRLRTAYPVRLNPNSSSATASDESLSAANRIIRNRWPSDRVARLAKVCENTAATCFWLRLRLLQSEFKCRVEFD